MHSLTSTRSRTRAVYGVALVITVLLGLASRHDPGGIPEFLGKYPGDALWAMMVFFGWGALRPKLSTLSVAVNAANRAFNASDCIPFSQTILIGRARTIFTILLGST